MKKKARKGSVRSYRVFVRDFWKPGPTLPDGTVQLEAFPEARKYTIAVRCTAKEATEIVAEYNSSHDPGLYSRKAEFEEED